MLVTPANEAETAQVLLVTAQTLGKLFGDRDYYHPDLREQLAGHGVKLITPYRFAGREPDPARARQISRIRYRIETVIDQLTEQYQIKRVWARDGWHFWGRLRRKFLSHTVACILAGRSGHLPLQHRTILQ